MSFLASGCTRIRHGFYEADAGLTERKLRTARRVGVQEGLWKEQNGTRPSDGTRTIFDRLDLVRVGLVAVEAELKSKEKRIEREGRDWKKGEYEERVRTLERARWNLLSLSDVTGEHDSEGYW